MADSGCRALFIGFESIDDATVKSTGKPQNRPRLYRDMVKRLHDHGIAVWGSFLFGFDTDTLSVFERTVEEAIEMKVTCASFGILTPYPGTPLYKRLLSEGRLTNERWWMGHDHDQGSPYFTPKNMSREQLKEGWVKAWNDFFTFSSMWQRFVLTKDSGWIQAFAYWPLNIAQNRLAHYKIAAGHQRHLTQGLSSH